MGLEMSCEVVYMGIMDPPEILLKKSLADQQGVSSKARVDQPWILPG